MSIENSQFSKDVELSFKRNRSKDALALPICLLNERSLSFLGLSQESTKLLQVTTILQELRSIAHIEALPFCGESANMQFDIRVDHEKIVRIEFAQLYGLDGYILRVFRKENIIANLQKFLQNTSANARTQTSLPTEIVFVSAAQEKSGDDLARAIIFAQNPHQSKIGKDEKLLVSGVLRQVRRTTVLKIFDERKRWKPPLEAEYIQRTLLSHEVDGCVTQYQVFVRDLNFFEHDEGTPLPSITTLLGAYSAI